MTGGRCRFVLTPLAYVYTNARLEMELCRSSFSVNGKWQMTGSSESPCAVDRAAAVAPQAAHSFHSAVRSLRSHRQVPASHLALGFRCLIYISHFLSLCSRTAFTSRSHCGLYTVMGRKPQGRASQRRARLGNGNFWKCCRQGYGFSPHQDVLLRHLSEAGRRCPCCAYPSGRQTRL